MKNLIKGLSGLSLIAIVLALALSWKINHWSEKKIGSDRHKTIYFRSGTKLTELSGVLQQYNIIDQGFLFHLWVRFSQDYSKFQAGRYLFSGPISPRDIVEKMTTGDVHRPVVLQVTIPEGFTLKKTLNRLESNNVGSKSDLWKLAKDKVFLKKIGVPSLEGFIYPATYTFYHRPTGAEVLETMVKNFFKMIPKSLIKRLSDENLTMLEATTFASLIELETQHEFEKPMIAEVIWRRLKRGEPLGIDASLIYGIKNFDGDVTWKHLSDRNNKYNSRIYKGLPPGPIGSPTLTSFQAILNPSNEGYYYYVLVADGKKQHHFSKTLSEHNRYVKKLLKASSKK